MQPAFAIGQAGTPGHPRAQRGVALLEVLAALALVGIVVAALLQAVTSGLRSASVSAEYSDAALTAESLLATAGAEEPLAEGAQEGETEHGHRWRIEVRPWSPPHEASAAMSGDGFGGVMIYHLTLHLHWDGADGEHGLVLDTLRAQARRQ